MNTSKAILKLVVYYVTLKLIIRNGAFDYYINFLHSPWHNANLTFMPRAKLIEPRHVRMYVNKVFFKYEGFLKGISYLQFFLQYYQLYILCFIYMNIYVYRIKLTS